MKWHHAIDLKLSIVQAAKHLKTAYRQQLDDLFYWCCDIEVIDTA